MGKMCNGNLQSLSKDIAVKILIFGISGLDGSYLLKFLLDKGYKVFGTSRSVVTNNFDYLKKITILI